MLWCYKLTQFKNVTSYIFHLGNVLTRLRYYYKNVYLCLTWLWFNGIKPNYVHYNKNLKCNHAIPINNIEFFIRIKDPFNKSRVIGKCTVLMNGFLDKKVYLKTFYINTKQIKISWNFWKWLIRLFIEHFFSS